MLAMGRDADLASAALRLSLGWNTTLQDVLEAANAIAEAIFTLKNSEEHSLG